MTEVKGTITDTENQPLPGVTVVIEGTTRGTTTDFDGNYSIEAEIGETLVFSYVGFEPQNIKYTGQSTIDVVMKVGVMLDSVVVTGSRSPGRTSVNSAVAVDVFDVEQLSKASPQVNLNQILNYAAPSFTSNTQTISDGTDHIDPASL